MKTAIITFTDQGEKLASSLMVKVPELGEAKTFHAHSEQDKKGLHKFAEKRFRTSKALIFIGSCGIAVRLIAPYIQDKTTDPAVIVMDEEGGYVIPILSGHLGGANDLARTIAKNTDAVPVITTATDVRGEFAIDEYAKKNDLIIEDKEDIVKVSSRVLAGGKVSVREGLFDDKVYITVDDLEVTLKKKRIIIGFGCKKDTDYSKIEVYITQILEDCGININDVGAVATIDIKQDEPGLVEWCETHRKRLVTFPAEVLMAQEGNFSSSEFVKDTTGTDNVCERAIVAAGGRVIVKKMAKYGMTVAIGKAGGRQSKKHHIAET